MQSITQDAPGALPGFVDSHSHLLKDSAGLAMPVAAPVVRALAGWPPRPPPPSSRPGAQPAAGPGSGRHR